MDPVLRIDFTKKMHMIGHHLQFQYRYLMFRGYFTKDGFQSSGSRRDQYFPSVLGTPNNIIFTRIDNIAIAQVGDQIVLRTCVLYCTGHIPNSQYLRSFAPPPYIPMPEGRGFTAGSVKMLILFLLFNLCLLPGDQVGQARGIAHRHMFEIHLSPVKKIFFFVLRALVSQSIYRHRANK
jgi:hypothetical protein